MFLTDWWILIHISNNYLNRKTDSRTHMLIKWKKIDTFCLPQQTFHRRAVALGEITEVSQVFKGSVASNRLFWLLWVTAQLIDRLLNYRTAPCMVMGQCSKSAEALCSCVSTALYLWTVMYFASPPPLLSTSASLMGTTEDERVGNAKEGERKQDAERARHGERNIDDINTRGNVHSKLIYAL